MAAMAGGGPRRIRDAAVHQRAPRPRTRVADAAANLAGGLMVAPDPVEHLWIVVLGGSAPQSNS